MVKIFIKLKKLINEESILKLMTLLLVILSIFILFVLVTFKITNFLTSDSASEVLLGKEVFSYHSLFPKDWFYSTEIRVLNIHLLVALFLNFSNNLISAKIFSNIIIIALLICSYLLFMKSLKVRKLNTFFFLAVLLTPFSLTILDMMYIGAFYAVYMIFIFFILACINFISNKEINIKLRIFLLIISVLVSFPLGLTGTRFLLNLYVPLIISECFILWFDLKDFKQLKSVDISVFTRFGASLAVTMSALIGFKFFKSILSLKLNFYDFGNQNFAKMDSLSSRFSSAITGTFDLFGAVSSGNLLTINGIGTALNFVFCIILIAMSLKLLLNISKLESSRKALLIFFYISLACNLYTLTFTEIPMATRYLINSFIMLFPLGALFLDVYSNWRSTVIRPILIILTILCIVFSQYNNSYKQDIKKDTNSNIKSVISYLEKNNLNFGYATFWNSNITQVLSSGKIEMGLINDNLDRSPYLWLTSKHIYSQSYHSGKTFLMLTDSEVKQAKPELLQGSTIATHISNFTIYVYDKNIFDIQ